jgi:curli biogenesis system outer membrane secretion channel CsgG|tara:strand:+ start:357 stop:1268 length:912 start_codon:yes stop_codon:yes gene_type:complete
MLKFYMAFSIMLSTFAFQDISAQSAFAQTSNESQATLKRKVAIARFSNETQSGTSFLVDDSGDRLGKQASDILSSKLAATGKFMMFERSDKDEIDSEQILAGLKKAGVAVDYLIIGSVSEFGRSVDSQSQIFKRTKTQRAYAKVNVRLVDVETGRIIFSEEGAGESVNATESKVLTKTNAGFDQSLTDKAISAAISSLVSSLVENMTNKPWKSYLLSEEDGSYIIAGGSRQGIALGSILNVYKKGKIILNPQTGATLELPGKKIGAIRVDGSFGEDDFSEISFTTLIEGSITEELQNYYISNT